MSKVGKPSPEAVISEIKGNGVYVAVDCLEKSQYQMESKCGVDVLAFGRIIDILSTLQKVLDVRVSHCMRVSRLICRIKNECSRVG